MKQGKGGKSGQEAADLQNTVERYSMCMSLKTFDSIFTCCDFCCNFRLQKELSVKELDYQESLKTMEGKNSAEIQSLNTKISELERSNGESKEEVCKNTTFCSFTCVHITCMYHQYLMHIHCMLGKIS